MTRAALYALAATAALACGESRALDTTMTPGGFTGLGITPNAHLLGWGRFEFTYDNQLPGAVNDPDGHNFVAGFGLLPNLELSGRVAANSLNDDCFAAPCGIRDLSASAKFGIGLDAANRFRIAAGATDLGGASTNFRSYYGVLTFNEGPYELSGGYARRSAAGGSNPRSPLDGPFAGAAWQPLPWIRGHVEYSDSNAWAGVRLFAPKEWLPDGWTAYLGANAQLTDSNLTARSWVTAGLSIPLYKVPTLPAQEARAPLPALAGTQPLPAYEARALPPPPLPVPPPAAELLTDDVLQELARALQARGFEDISIGRMADGSVAVRANNATYNWNTSDAVGAALGGIAQTLGTTKAAYRLIVTQRQIPMVAVTGQADCLRQWISNPTPGCAAGELSTPGTGALEPLHAGASWVVRDLQPSWKTLRLALTPVLRTNVATEVGVLDYSAGINLGMSLSLWSGAVAEWRIDQELARSDDYEQGGLLYRRRIRNGTERLALTQTVRVPLERWLAPGDDVMARRWGLAAVTAQGTIGRIGNHFDGVYGSLRWEPGEGRHRLTVQGGWLDNADFGAIAGEPREPRPLLGTYRYNVAATRTYLEATAGQFMNNDRGVQLGLRQWFSDVAVQLYFKRTQFDGAPWRTLAGIELSLPIGPRRDMNPGGIQLTGTPRFAHAIETVVGEDANVVTSGRGVLPPAPSLDALHNSDRASLLYFEDNIRRIRDAAK